MYFENSFPANSCRPTGSIEVICGSMFSGKTEELIRRINRVKIAKRNIMIFKPSLDYRYSQHDIVSHRHNSSEAIPVQSSRVISNMVTEEVDVVAIDEAQFFDHNIVNVANELASAGKRVILAGLDMDFMGQPFGPMPNLMAIADDVYKCRAICMKCGHLANYSYRIADSAEQVLIGEKQEYMPLCRKCYEEMMQDKNQNG